MKKTVFWLVEIVLGFVFMLGFIVYIVFQHFQEIRKYSWLGWKDEVEFWLTGAFTAAMLVIFYFPVNLTIRE